MIRRQSDALTKWAVLDWSAPPSGPQSVQAKAHAMPPSIVARVGFDADAAHTRGDLKRWVAVAQPRDPERPTPGASEVLDAANEDDDADGRVPSTAGLSILAQALAAYSQY
jgi:hypothetical protein